MGHSDSFFGMVATQCCNQIALFSYVTIAIWILYVSISTRFLYKASGIAIFSIASFYVLCINAFDGLALTLISNCYGGQGTFLILISEKGFPRTAMLVLVKGLWMVLCGIFEKYFHKISMEKKHVYTILVVSAIGWIGTVYLMNQTFRALTEKTTNIWFIFNCAIAFGLFATYFVTENRKEKMKLAVSEMRTQLLEQQYKEMSDIYTENAKLYHDLNNHLTVLYQLLEDEKTSEAKRYVAKISEPIKNLSRVVWTGEDVIDVVINSKLQRMKDKEIRVEVNIEFPHNTNLLPNDMCTLLANLLDNAIEATEKERKKGNISLTIRRINHFLMIRIVNPCDKEDNDDIKYLETAKQNKSLHGWGLQSVRSVVEKYDGTMKCKIENHEFVVTIMLCFDKS